MNFSRWTIFLRCTSAFAFFFLIQRGFAQDTRPNILFIFSDDHTTQAISAYHEERNLIQTPNIDRLAKEGMIFQRCLVTNSICGPSRATVLTGTYSHINGFYNNADGETFDGSQVTFPKLLQAAGYQTAIIGKWHLGSNPTGFDFWQILDGQGQYYQPPMIQNGKRISTTGHITDITVNATLDWLKQRDPHKPFLMMFQQKAPHRDWEPRIQDLNFDNGRVYPEPPTLTDDYSGRGIAEKDQKMMISEDLRPVEDLKMQPPKRLTADELSDWKAYYGPLNEAFKNAHLTGRALLDWKYQRYVHDYLACVHGVDDSVGQVLKYLDDNGLSKNTIVIYSADQGFFIGEHGWFDKRWVFEESLRAPLLVRWPGVVSPGSVNNDIVSNLDFAETLLDAAKVPIPPVMQGRSLVPLLEGKTPTDWRTSFYYQYYEYPTPHHVRPHYAVVTDRYKLVKFYGTGEDYTELFDLQTDPHEMKSQFSNPAYASTIATLETELSRLRKELKVPDVTPDAAYGKNGNPMHTAEQARERD